jgi:hypothetical protein
MNLNNFTIKAQEAIAKAQQLAFDGSNPCHRYGSSAQGVADAKKIRWWSSC